MAGDVRYSPLGRVVAAFLGGKLSIMIVLCSLVAGLIALSVTPREEEPQIVVPLADIFVRYPGADVGTVERLVSARLERLLYQIDGVEYVYSQSRPGLAVVTVRFFVGEDRENSLIKLYNKLEQNMDRVTPGIAGWLVRPIEIDDVPVWAVTLTGHDVDSHALYRLAEELAARLQHVPDSARITIHGGEPRVAHVVLDPERLAAYGLSPMAIMAALEAANAQQHVGQLTRHDTELRIEAGPFLRAQADLANVLVAVHANRPVYLRDVGDVHIGPGDRTHYSWYGVGAAGRPLPDGNPDLRAPAVTIAVAKKPGSNAVRVTRQLQQQLDALQPQLLPAGVSARVTRDYGETANDKVNNLVGSLGLAIITVIGLLALTMNWRAGLIVALAVPITYSLTLLCNLLLGYTINRVTLFALILALGLLVDDPIAGVENIERHLSAGRRSRFHAVVGAMDEIMAPILLSTLAVILAFSPMFFITGMMGPYMRPMALNVPIAVLMSTVVALTVTPWISEKLLRRSGDAAGTEGTRPTEITETRLYRIYARILAPLVDEPRKAKRLLVVVSLLFIGSLALAVTGGVPLKMLPFDNKNEFQLLVDLPETTTLERTDQVVREIEDFLRGVPEVVDFVSVVGASTPMDFNGMVRQYYLREAPHLADLRVNLLHQRDRRADSHAIVLRIRNAIEAIGERAGASVKLIEAPPGPPVLATVVAEIYGQPHHDYADLVAAASTVRARMSAEPGLVDVDDTVEIARPKQVFEVDQRKAAEHGIAKRDVVETLSIALDGRLGGILHAPREQNELPIRIRLPRADRASLARLSTIPVTGRDGRSVVQLGELGVFREKIEDQPRYHKNQTPVVYVTAEAAGVGPAYPILSLQRYFRDNPLAPGLRIDWRGEGEWKITLDVFRDLGIAFSVALLGIYVLLVYQTGSYGLPGVIMLSIPLTLIGIMPGFWLLNLLVDRPVGGYANPVFFTATAMIGMIALSGIVVRNAIVLIDFIQQAVAGGRPLREATLECGCIRMRPILLTAGTTLLGAWPITFDPIFSGLAWSIIFGLLVSTVFTLVVVPVVYTLLYRETR